MNESMNEWMNHMNLGFTRVVNMQQAIVREVDNVKSSEGATRDVIKQLIEEQQKTNKLLTSIKSNTLSVLVSIIIFMFFIKWTV